MAIRNIKHKGLKALFEDGSDGKLGRRYARNAKFILDFLDALEDIAECKDVKDFHALKGARKDNYSMHVSGNYCITFKWNGKDVYDVEFEDYH